MRSDPSRLHRKLLPGPGTADEVQRARLVLVRRCRDGSSALLCDVIGWFDREARTLRLLPRATFGGRSWAGRQEADRFALASSLARARIAVLIFGIDSQFVDMRFDTGSPPNLVAYLAPEGFVPELRHEIGDKIAHVYGRLIVAYAPVLAAAWVANVWLDAITIPIRSIGDGAEKLRAMQRDWALYSFALHRRAVLIEGRLPSVSAKPMVFGADPPKAALGSWTLIDANTILASTNCSSAFPNGVVGFVEDRRAPPSRACLKLWEFFTLFGRRPRPGELCLDLGARPGGWTWVLQQLGAHV